LSIRVAARQMSISGITAQGYRLSESDPEERRNQDLRTIAVSDLFLRNR
jgi:hypothetical protein